MNNLYLRKLVILVILFICEDTIIAIAQSSSNDSTKYDFTNVLNEAILKLLKSTDLVEKLQSQILLIEDVKRYGSTYEINNTAKLRPFGNTIDLNYLTTFGSASTRSLVNRYPPNTIRWEFSENKMVKYHEYKNLSIIATKLQVNQKDDNNISINTSYDCLKNPEGIKLGKHPKLSYKQHLKLIYIIGLELPSIMRSFFNKSGIFTALLGKIFNLNPKQHIISACPDFSTNEQRYYYLLPDISSVYVSFKNITIRGLSNFESFVNNQSWSNRYISYDLVYTLHVKNVRGNMTLEAGLEDLQHFQLNFFIGNLYILFVPKKQEFRVEALNYSVVEDSPQPSTLISVWLPKYSTSIIQLIESAVIDSLMPSKNYKQQPSSLFSNFAQIETSFVELLKKSHPRTR
ncbi:uncharacterized protein LOC135837093 isoform X2 [Planococcus citri]|uniref:uncharacterized protein LOC135837093 isoform X2 n=1 Tax=Planococcus citri TaxID=170843 RepID=UPI0031F97C3A